MESNRMLISTEPAGTHSGTVFDDKSNVPNIDKAVIQKIGFGHSSYLHSIMVDYGIQSATRHGAAGYTPSEAVLEPGEFITSLQGNYLGGAISDLRLKSNKGNKWGPYGTYSPDSTTHNFAWSAPSPGMGLLYVSGRADTAHVYQLRATWAMYLPFNDNHPSSLNYEEHIIDDSSTSPAIVSKFARNLMSPIVTLVVGEEGIEFHACESILCSLAFFRAAFQGGFREAEEKKITMPEDEPEIVAALIEFLYNENYTYAFDPQTVERSDRTVGTTVLPIGNSREGAFHVRVYAIASKYTCEPLVKAAVKNFIYILLQLKGIDVVRHWKTAYENGLFLSDWEDDAALAGFKKGLAKVLKDLYAAHREEMDKTFAEYPVLGADFLRVAVCGSISA